MNRNHKNAGLLGLLLTGALLLTACMPISAPAGDTAGGTVPPAGVSEEFETKTLFIGPERKECVGVVPMQCMQVAETADGEYLNFFNNIDGFRFVPGYNYEIVVRVYTRTDVPADASSLLYVLEEIVSQTPAYAGEALPLVGTEWTLVAFGEEQMATTPVTLNFDGDGYYGNGGCNNFMGSYTFADGVISFSPAAATMMACESGMEVEAAFFQALESAGEYVIDGNMLTIVYAAGQLVFIGQ
jgi:heat shock protein HslJ